MNIEILQEVVFRLSQISNNYEVNKMLQNLIFDAINSNDKLEGLRNFVLYNCSKLRKLNIYLNKDTLIANEIGFYIDSYGDIRDNSIGIIINSDIIETCRACNSAIAICITGEIIAFDKTRIYALNNSLVSAYDHSQIYAQDQSIIAHSQKQNCQLTGNATYVNSESI